MVQLGTPCHDMNHATPCPTTLDHTMEATLCPTTPDYNIPYCTMTHQLYHTMPCLLDYATPYQARPCHAMPDQITSYHTSCITLHNSRLYHTVPCMPSQTALHHATVCHATPGHTTPCSVMCLLTSSRGCPRLIPVRLGALSVFPSVHPHFAHFGWVNLRAFQFWLLRWLPALLPWIWSPLQPRGDTPLSSPGL